MQLALSMHFFLSFSPRGIVEWQSSIWSNLINTCSSSTSLELIRLGCNLHKFCLFVCFHFLEKINFTTATLFDIVWIVLMRDIIAKEFMNGGCVRLFDYLLLSWIMNKTVKFLMKILN